MMDDRFLLETGYDWFIAQTSGSAGEWSYVPAAGFRIQILSIRLTLSTDATAANRQVHLVFHKGDTSDERVVARAGITQPASTNYTYFFTVGAKEDTALVNSSYVLCRLPYPVEIWGTGSNVTGWSITTDTDNGQAGDVFSSRVIYGRAVVNAS